MKTEVFAHREPATPEQRELVDVIDKLCEALIETMCSTDTSLNALMNVWLRMVILADQVEGGLGHLEVARQVLMDPVKRNDAVGRVLS